MKVTAVNLGIPSWIFPELWAGSLRVCRITLFAADAILNCNLVYPVYVAANEDVADAVRHVKDFRRKIPANGREYFARRCLTPDGPERFRSHWPWEISFNYLGQYQVISNQLTVDVD